MDAATHITGPEVPFSTPAAPPATGAETPVEDENFALVSNYEMFAWNQVFTLLEPLPAPVFIDLLNTIIEREFDPDLRLRAMRMAAGVAEWTHQEFMRANFGYDEPEGCPESEAASRDPHEVERHLILTSSLAMEVQDTQFPRLAAGWLGIGTGVAEREAYYDLIESQPTVVKILRKEAPAEYLRAAVRGRCEAAYEVRCQQSGGRSLVSLGDSQNARAYAESARPEPDQRAALEKLIEALRKDGDPVHTRLAAEIDAVLDGATKGQIGDAGYQHLHYHLPRLRAAALDAGLVAPGSARRSTAKRRRVERYSYRAPDTWYRRNPRADSVEHRYSGEALVSLGEISIGSLPFADGGGLLKKITRASSNMAVWPQGNREGTEA
jgi:hypothetical protein